MDARAPLQQALQAATLRVLRPLFRVLLRHSMSFAAFEELAKRVYVDVAMNDFAIEGKKPSISRASILSGLTRKEVSRLLSSGLEAADVEGDRYNRAARVLTGWVRDPDFAQRGEPRALSLEGPSGFAELVKRHSGDMPARAVLDELQRVGAVRQRDDGLYELQARAYVPQASTLDKLGILGHDVADLIDTIDHNVQHGATDARFQRKVMYRGIPVESLPAFRKLSADLSQSLLERLDHWLHTLAEEAGRQQAQGKGPAATTTARVGVGIHYFEERSGAAAPEDAPR
jgi:hypothetical protein